jgi:hypothetical protein
MRENLKNCTENILKTESNIPGVLSRISIMSALHFDFRLALKDLQNVGDLNFAEDETNKKIFINTLNSLKEIQTKNS